MNKRYIGNDRAFSAGSRPTGEPHPDAIRILERAGYATAGLRSKSWDEFSAAGAVQPDIVITLCNSAAAEECPAWMGATETIHWGLPDPAAVENSNERQQAFKATLADIEQRIDDLLRG